MKPINTPKNSNIVKAKDMHIPVLVHTKIPGLPTKNTLDAEKQIAKDTRLFHHIATFSDVNKKKKIIHPASSVAASENYLIPQLLDSAPNCGMRVIATNLTDEDASQQKLNRLFEYLVKTVPTRKYVGSNIPFDVIVQSFIKGSQPISEYLKTRTKNEISNTYEQGNMFNSIPEKLRLKSRDDLLDVIPSRLVNLARYRLGILGATKSHFLTLMKVDSILNEGLAKSLNLKQGQYVFFMHTGSGILGRYIGYLYSAQPKSFIQSLQFDVFTKGFGSQTYRNIRHRLKTSTNQNHAISYKDDSPELKMAIKAWQAGANQGFANRSVITHNLDQALEKIYKRQINLNLLYDAPHELVSYEKHYGKNLWVHRNGATRSLGPQELSKHKTYSSSGEPALIAPFENTFGYIGMGTKNNQTTFQSANHELGKLTNTSKETFNSIDTKNVYEFDPVKIHTQKHSKIVNPQSLHANFSETIAAEIASNKLLNMAVRLKSVRTLTHYS